MYPSKKTQQRNVKFTPGMNEMLEVIARYEGVTSVPVLIREWVRDKVKHYQTNPRFKRYLRTHPEEKERLERLGELLP